MNLVEHFRQWFARRQPELSQETLERLRAEFSVRYDCFRNLLSANRKALDAMARMQLAASGDEAVSMPLVRRLAMEVMMAVLRMINNLTALAPAGYQGLSPCFENLKQRMEEALGGSGRQEQGPLVMGLSQAGQEALGLVGSKMASLALLSREADVNVTRGVVITTAAYWLLLERNGLNEEIARRLQIADMEETEGLFEACSGIQALFLKAGVPDEVAGLVEENLQRMGRETGGRLRLAVRSSATGEDQAGSSFAGQFESELNVDPANWQEAYLQVLASLYSPSAVSYRLRAGLRDQDAAMAVACLAMIEAEAGGVMYTADPLDPRREMVFINSCWGLPKAVVDGSWDCDQFEVAPGPPPRLVQERIVPKPKLYVCDRAEGVLPEKASGEKARAPSLSREQVLALAEIGRRLGKSRGGPQDIEWALDREGRFHLLQCRPLPVADSLPLAAEEKPEEECLAKGGITASPGQGAGPVRWVVGGGDAVSFQGGEVLVLEQPLPRWAPLLGKASALVAVNGGMAGHLASVARELGVPALLGLGERSRRLVNGAPVTVDASRRAIYPGLRRAAREGGGRGPLNPVRQTLQQVLDLTAPLNLLDPHAPEFRPENCRTLHDLTRFCHQKAVEEMFSQSAREHFPLNAAKRLYYQVPMQWWVLDLGGGLADGDDGKYVFLDHIVCPPFHAFWQGFTEVPWEGPPAPDAKGMASVMLQASMNPQLEALAKGRMAESNYFLLAADFMNLQSHLGFHFTSLEVSATEQPGENFLNFCFRGGAADEGRRRGRLELLEELLNGLAMDTELKADALLASCEGRAKREILVIVKALGFLMMHTRQLDMIMADPAAVARYRHKLATGMAGLGPPPVRAPMGA